MPLSLTILLLMAVQFVTAMVMDVVMSNAPALAQTYAVAEAMTPILNIGFLISGIFGPVFGFMADRKSVKTVLVLGTFLFTLGCLLTAFASNLTLYILTRGLIGVGYNIFYGLVAAYLAKLVHQDQLLRLSGFTKLAFALGVFAAPVLGNVLISMGGFKLFYLWMTVVSVVLTGLLLFIPEVRNVHPESMTLNDLKALIKEPYVKILLGTYVLFNYPPNVIFYYLGIYLSSIGFDRTTIALIYSLLGAGAILSGLIMIFLARRFSSRQLLKAGSLSVVLAMIPMAMLTPVLLIPAGFIFGIAVDLMYGVFFPVAAHLDLRRSASLITLCSLAASLSLVVTTFVNPLLYEFIGFGGMILLAAFATALGYLGLRRIFRLIPEHV